MSRGLRLRGPLAFNTKREADLAGRDLKLQACLRAFEGVDQLDPLATAEIQSVADVYHRNVSRVNSLILFPPASIQFAIQTQRAVDQVQSRTPRSTGKARTDAIEAILKQDREKLEGAPESYRAKLNAHMEKLTFRIIEMIPDNDASGQEAWLASQITTSWTAFEAMAGDLWEAAVNCKPRELSKLSGRKQSAESKMIAIDYIHKYDFDLSKHMGTILSNKYQFDRLQGIREAYKDAFGADIEAVINDRALDAISIIRNNLVHNGGVIDEKYRRRGADLPAEALGDVGSMINLD